MPEGTNRMKQLSEILEQLERENPKCKEFNEMMKKKIADMYGDQNAKTKPNHK